MIATPEASNIPVITEDPLVRFKDISGVEWAKKSIENLASKGIISGMGDGTFQPDEKVTREQFVKMLVSACNLLQDNATVQFMDVSGNEWYYPYVASAKELGIINGMSDGSFGIGKEITRQEMTVILYRAAQQKKIKLSQQNAAVSFSDADDIEPYAEESIQMMQQAGLVNGMENGKFAPKEYATRAMAAKVIFELTELMK